VVPLAAPVEFWIVSVPVSFRAFAAEVYVTPATTLESKVTELPNSFPAIPPQVIVRDAFEMNVIDAARDQEAEVLESVQVPLVTVHEPPVAVM